MSGLPPLRLLTTFAEVARAGSMREAAARLNVTQPAITQALKALEAHVQVPLFDRSTKPARLTPAGLQLAQATRDGLSLIGTTIDDLRIRNTQKHRQVTVACTLGMATHWLLPRLPDFYADNPETYVNVQTTPGDMPRLVPGIDVILRYGRGTWTDGTTVTLFRERMCPVGRPELVDRLIAGGVDLAEAPLIHVRRPEGGDRWEDWADYLTATGRQVPTRPGEIFDNYVHAVQAALDGRGLILGWRSITARLIAEGSLAPWPGSEYDPGTAYCATRNAAAPSEAVSRFFEWLRVAAENGDSEAS